MIEGFIFGTIVWISNVFAWLHLPRWLKRISIKRFLLTDIITTLITWLTISAISKSLVAVIACVVSGFLMNLTMMTMKNKLIRDWALKEE